MNRKFGKRLFSGLLALCVAAMIPLSVSAQTVAEIQAEQDRLQAEKDQLEAQLEQLRNDEAEKQAAAYAAARAQHFCGNSAAIISRFTCLEKLMHAASSRGVLKF